MSFATHAAFCFSVLRRRAAFFLCATALSLFASDFSPAAQQPSKKSAPAKKEQKPGPLEVLVRQAEQALEKEDFATAVKALEEYLTYRPEDAIAHFQLGYAFTALGRGEDARAQYEKALALDPKMGAAHLNLGLLLLDRDPNGAIPPLEKAAGLMPTEARPRFLLGVAHERRGKLQEAIAHYAAARNLDGRSADTRFALARALLAAGRVADAEPEFRAVLALRPDFAPARLGLAEALLALGKGADAAGQFAAYLEKNPGDNETRIQLAGLYLDLERNEEALAELARVESAGHVSVRLHKLRAVALTRLKRYAEAAASLEEAVALAPDDAEAHARLGRLRMEQRDFPGAEKALLAALRLKPDFTEALRDLVATYYAAENFAAALDAMDQLGRRETLPPGSWFVRAVCYDKLGRKPEALAAYKNFVELDGGRTERQDFQARQRIRILTRELERKK
jgi:Flp pilus assembly protein TadD